MSEAIEFPEGEYAIVEVLGHRTIVGLIEEVERFGAKLMSIRPIYAGNLLAPVLIGGGSIYQFTPCRRETAIARAPKDIFSLPTSIRAALPPELLPASAGATARDHDDDMCPHCGMYACSDVECGMPF
jgi:hypothetical protein